MISVGIRELKQRTSELVRLVHDTGSEVQITHRGKAVALLIPVRRKARSAEEQAGWIELDALAAQIGAHWPAGVSAEQAVQEGRE